MWKISRYRSIIMAGVAVAMAASGAASAADTRDITAFKTRRAYTVQPVQRDFGIQNYTFFPGTDAKDVTFRVYKNDYAAIDSYFRNYFDINGAIDAFKGFTAEVESAKDMKIYNFITDIYVPQRFRAFANSIEYAFGVASKEAGYTFNVNARKVDQFFYTYFSTNVGWNVDSAFTAFKTEFGFTDDKITFATFRDFFFVPGMVRFFANSFTGGVRSVDVKAVEVNRE